MACPTGTPDWDNIPWQDLNQTLLDDPSLCTTCTCPLRYDDRLIGTSGYFPNLAGNALYTAIFALLLVSQVLLGIRYRTWGFLAGMVGGLVLEIIGYAARIGMRSHIFDREWFIMYIVCLTIGPAFLSASIYLTLSRIVTIFSAAAARFRPQVYTYLFIGCDFFALVLQAAGGGIASGADPGSAEQDSGVNLMIAGVAWQVFSLFLFGALCVDFALRVRRHPKRNPDFAELRAKRTFQAFLWALVTATLAIFVRSVYRCAELSDGFGGPLANQEVTFMVLEGVMIIVAGTALTVFHPGLVLGASVWGAASWTRGKLVSEDDVVVEGMQGRVEEKREGDDASDGS